MRSPRKAASFCILGKRFDPPAVETRRRRRWAGRESREMSMSVVLPGAGRTHDAGFTRRASDVEVDPYRERAPVRRRRIEDAGHAAQSRISAVAAARWIFHRLAPSFRPPVDLDPILLRDAEPRLSRRSKPDSPLPWQAPSSWQRDRQSRGLRVTLSAPSGQFSRTSATMSASAEEGGRADRRRRRARSPRPWKAEVTLFLRTPSEAILCTRARGRRGRGRGRSGCAPTCRRAPGRCQFLADDAAGECGICEALPGDGHRGECPLRRPGRHGSDEEAAPGFSSRAGKDDAVSRGAVIVAQAAEAPAPGAPSVAQARS